MQTFDAVLFDLAGTLIDSAPGIFDSFEFTLAQYEMTVPQERLRRFLGPPLRESFAKLLPPDEIERAVEIYRAHYAEASGALTKLYPGTKELLSALREAGYIVCLATSKVRYAALKLLDKLELTPYFDYIGGSSPDASLDTKTAVIRHVLAQPCVQGKRVLMVGDRNDDMRGAADCHLDAAAVLYGYGSREELVPFAPVFFADSCEDLADRLLANA